MVLIKVSEIRDDFDLYYKKYPEAARHVEELAIDIANNGLREPIEIHKIDNGYEVVEGVHRFRAIKQLGWTEVECKIISHGPHPTPCPRNRYSYKTMLGANVHY